MSYWNSAAKDLGLEIEKDYVLELAGERIKANYLVKNFGARRGMLVFHKAETVDGLEKKIIAEGFGYSVMSDAPENAYDRLDLIDVLRDWGWSGTSEKRPDWIESV